jgi:hypothetical protein
MGRSCQRRLTRIAPYSYLPRSESVTRFAHVRARYWCDLRRIRHLQVEEGAGGTVGREGGFAWVAGVGQAGALRERGASIVVSDLFELLGDR